MSILLTEIERTSLNPEHIKYTFSGSMHVCIYFGERLIANLFCQKEVIFGTLNHLLQHIFVIV